MKTHILLIGLLLQILSNGQFEQQEVLTISEHQKDDSYV